MFFSKLLNTNYTKAIYLALSASGEDKILPYELLQSMPQELTSFLNRGLTTANYLNKLPALIGVMILIK